MVTQPGHEEQKHNVYVVFLLNFNQTMLQAIVKINFSYKIIYFSVLTKSSHIN